MFILERLSIRLVQNSHYHSAKAFLISDDLHQHAYRLKLHLNKRILLYNHRQILSLGAFIMEAMDPRIVEALKSRDPEERKKGVRALGQMLSSEALRYLATIFKSDPDQGVRELAVKAGRHVKKMRAAGDWVGHDADKDVRFGTTEMAAVPSGVSAGDKEQAKGLLEKALDETVKGDYKKGEQYVRQAFQLNPDLQFDTYAVGVASDVLGMSADEALAALSKPPK
jgi:hypothetical protein